MFVRIREELFGEDQRGEGGKLNLLQAKMSGDSLSFRVTLS